MKQGFLQALGVAGYCSLVGLIFWKGNDIFPEMNPYFGPVLFLLLFSTSALICGLIVFYKPYKLFFSGKKKEAVVAVASTALYLFIFLVTFFTTLILTK
jgi:hypothetical protein